MAAETSFVSGIAGRYATALFELAVEQKQLDAVAADLDGIRTMLNDSDDLRRLVRSPLFQRDAQAKAMAAVLDRAGAGDLIKRFVGLVARNRRLFALPNMIRDFNTLLARHRGEVVADVIAATPLSDAQLDQLRAALKHGVGTDVKLRTSVDGSLIGGLVVKVGSRMIDSSINTKLQNLRLAMKGVG